MIPLPSKLYNIIYADPPWTYEDKASAGERGAIYKYHLLTIEEIKLLPINLISAPNCSLFLWVTMPQLPVAFEVISAWGFSYKTVAFTWIKKNPKSGTNFWGMGNWTRANPELCLLATRGSPKRISANVHSVVESPIREHSQKPWEVRDAIVELMGDLPRIELFARSHTDNWDYWGI